MILVGIRNLLIATRKTRTGICPNCGQQFTLLFKIYRKHIRFFFIPTFPFFKTGLIECSNCAFVFSEKELPPKLQEEFRQVKKEVKGPLWQFIGIVVFIALILWYKQYRKEDKLQEKELLNNPEVNDVYRVKIKRKTVTFWKVEKVSADSVYIVPNRFEASKILDQVRIQEDSNYLDSSFGASREQLLEWFENKKIVSVRRK